MTPTVSGLFTGFLKPLTLSETDTVTPQEAVDIGYSCAIAGAAIAKFRDHSIVKGLGEATYKRFKEKQIAGVI